MAATDLGKVGIVMKGDYSSASAYEVLDTVNYNGGLYIAKQAVPAGTLPSNTTYWQPAVDALSFSMTSQAQANVTNIDDFDGFGHNVYILTGHYANNFTLGTFPSSLGAGTYIIVVQIKTGARILQILFNVTSASPAIYIRGKQSTWGSWVAK